MFLNLFFFLVWTIPVLAQEEEKPEAAVSPLATIGDISEVQKKIVLNSLLATLSKYYQLISQERFLEAQN